VSEADSPLPALDSTRTLARAALHAAIGTPARWSVWRQDDSGNRFEVSRGLSRTNAARELARFESLGHKQTYWTAPTSG